MDVPAAAAAAAGTEDSDTEMDEEDTIEVFVGASRVSNLLEDSGTPTPTQADGADNGSGSGSSSSAGSEAIKLSATASDAPAGSGLLNQGEDARTDAGGKVDTGASAEQPIKQADGHGSGKSSSKRPEVVKLAAKTSAVEASKQDMKIKQGNAGRDGGGRFDNVASARQPPKAHGSNIHESGWVSFQQLSDEIAAFQHLVALKPSDERVRNDIIATLRQIAKEVFGPGTVVTPFGSFATGLAIISSDIDMTVYDVCDGGGGDGVRSSVSMDGEKDARQFKTPSPKLRRPQASGAQSSVQPERESHHDEEGKDSHPDPPEKRAKFATSSPASSSGTTVVAEAAKDATAASAAGQEVVTTSSNGGHASPGSLPTTSLSSDTQARAPSDPVSSAEGDGASDLAMVSKLRAVQESGSGSVSATAGVANAPSVVSTDGGRAGHTTSTSSSDSKPQAPISAPVDEPPMPSTSARKRKHDERAGQEREPRPAQEQLEVLAHLQRNAAIDKLEKLASRLREYRCRHFVANCQVQVKRARVPIITFKTTHRIECDVRYEAAQSQDAATAADEAAAANSTAVLDRIWPVTFRPLFLVLKCFMVQQDLDKPYMGGIGSHRLGVLLGHYLLHHGADKDLARLLCGFFNYWHLNLARDTIIEVHGVLANFATTRFRHIEARAQ